MSLRKLLHNFDPFRDQKEEAYITALPVIAQMGEYLLTLINDIEDTTEIESINLLKVGILPTFSIKLYSQFFCIHFLS